MQGGPRDSRLVSSPLTLPSTSCHLTMTLSLTSSLGWDFLPPWWSCSNSILLVGNPVLVEWECLTRSRGWCQDWSGLCPVLCHFSYLPHPPSLAIPDGCHWCCTHILYWQWHYCAVANMGQEPWQTQSHICSHLWTCYGTTGHLIFFILSHQGHIILQLHSTVLQHASVSIASWLMHVEHSRGAYTSRPQVTSPTTHVIQLVYIYSQ